MFQENAYIGYSPNPLLPLIINLRARIDACFEQLKLIELSNINEAVGAIGVLLDALLSGTPDDLGVIPEYTTGLLHEVNIFGSIWIPGS